MTRGPGSVSGCGLEVGPGCRREDRRVHLRRRLGLFAPDYVADSERIPTAVCWDWERRVA